MDSLTEDQLLPQFAIFTLSFYRQLPISLVGDSVSSPSVINIQGEAASMTCLWWMAFHVSDLLFSCRDRPLQPYLFK